MRAGGAVRRSPRLPRRPSWEMHGGARRAAAAAAEAEWRLDARDSISYTLMIGLLGRSGLPAKALLLLQVFGRRGVGVQGLGALDAGLIDFS